MPSARHGRSDPKRAPKAPSAARWAPWRVQRPPVRWLQVLGAGALLGGGRGAVVGDHAGGFPAAGKHGLGGAGAVGGKLG